MNQVSRIGMDTSKSVFQLHGVDANDKVALRRKVRRSQVVEFFGKLAPTRIGMEACGGAHYWARELKALGHEVVVLPPQYVKPYVKRGKNDAADAEAICEAMSRPSMRFVPVKTAEQQAAQMLIGLRDNLVRRRTQLTNSIRGYAAEFGLVAAKGLDKIDSLLARIAADTALPELARELFAMMAKEHAELQARVREIDLKLVAWQEKNELCRRLLAIPGIGPIGAALLAVKVTDPRAFRSGRDLSAWLGLTPKDHSTAGKQRLGVITRAGDEDLRRVLVTGATSVIKQLKNGKGQASPWLGDLLRRKPAKLVAVALANKTARIAWRLMVSGERYDRARGAATPAGRAASPCEGSTARPAGVARAATRGAASKRKGAAA